MADGFTELKRDTLNTPDGLSELNRMLSFLYDQVAGDGETVRVYRGYGTPESVITAGIGSIYFNLSGGANTTLYVKESGANTGTGWVAK